MGVKWQEKKDSTGFSVFYSNCGKYSCLKEKYHGMFEDGRQGEFIHWVVMMKGYGYAGGWGIIAITNTAKESTNLVNEWEAAQVWPVTLVDIREHLVELRRLVDYYGAIARENREFEQAARKEKMLIEAYAENERRNREDQAQRDRDEAARVAREQAEADLAAKRQQEADAKELQKAQAKAAKDAEKVALKAAKHAEKAASKPARKPRKETPPEVVQESLFG